jgi:hypothetical protein
MRDGWIESSGANVLRDCRSPPATSSEGLRSPLTGGSSVQELRDDHWKEVVQCARRSDQVNRVKSLVPATPFSTDVM